MKTPMKTETQTLKLSGGVRGVAGSGLAGVWVAKCAPKGQGKDKTNLTEVERNK